jgi:phage tail-like protein
VSTAFDADLGTYQGRIPKDGAPEGDYVYELGHALPNVVRWFADGDAHTTVQTADLAGTTLLRFTLDIRPPTAVPLGLTWTFSVDVDGTQTLSFDIVPGRTRRRVDLAMNVVAFDAAGDVPVTFSLAVSGTPATTYEAEMPSVQLDAVLLDTTVESPVLIARDPEPGDTGVPSATTIAFSVTDPRGGASPPTVTDVYVNGTLVVIAGAAQGSWTISDSSPDALTTAYLLTPPDLFGSEEVVTVRVLSSSNSGTGDQTWSFTCEDTLAPELVSVLGFSRREIRVEFDEPVEQGDGTGANDALNPANYILTLSSGAPAIVPTILSVEAISGSVVVLQLDEEMTPGPYTLTDGTVVPGATYLLTIEDVADEDGNVVVAPGLQALFTGYACPAVPGRQTSVLSLYQKMPKIVRFNDLLGTVDLKTFLACLQEPTDQILCDIDAWTDILDIDLAPEAFVDAMLADLGNPFEEFSAAFSLAEKRKLAKVLVAVYKQKGTNQGMVNAIRLILGLEVTISVPALEDVWEIGVSELGEDTYLGTTDLYAIYSFYVVSGISLTDQQRTDIRKIVAFMRRAETHLAGFVEPDPPPIVPDHWELGLSELGTETLLH